MRVLCACCCALDHVGSVLFVAAGWELLCTPSAVLGPVALRDDAVVLQLYTSACGLSMVQGSWHKGPAAQSSALCSSAQSCELQSVIGCGE